MTARAPSLGLVLRAVLLALVSACGGDPPAAVPPAAQTEPSDDPNDHAVDGTRTFTPVLSEPLVIAPSALLPPDLPSMASNNNVAIEHFDGRLFVAYRTAPFDFASPDTVMNIVSTADGGQSFQREASFNIGTDMREPQLYVAGDTLVFTFLEAGKLVTKFEPKQLWRMRRPRGGSFGERETWGQPAEIVWDLKRRNGRFYLTSYTGNHYAVNQEIAVAVHFKESVDGFDFHDVDPAKPDVYVGGASEAAFEIMADGSLWAMLRNEDGDATGFGSLLCHAPAGALANWQCPTVSDPERCDSPKMLRHGNDLYLVARRDIGGPFDERSTEDLTLGEKQQRYAIDYWKRPKRTALYRVDTTEGRVVPLLDFPSAGDTAFPSVRRLSAHAFLIANYTSPPSDPDRSWSKGQSAADGTRVDLTTLRFEPAGD